MSSNIFLAKETCFISEDSKLGKNCTIYPSVVIINSTIGDNVTIQTGAIIKDSSIIGNDCFIGPSAIVRDNSKIGNKTIVGPGSEVKKSTIGNNCSFGHKNFVGDATIGNNVSFGFGACIANYDFKNYQHTKIEDNVKIGCNSTIIAPVVIGANSIIAACTKLTKDVPQNSFVKEQHDLVVKKNREE